MRHASHLALIGGVLLLVAACGGTPAASQAPGASTPVVAPTQGGGGVPVSAICQGLATFSLQTPQPSFATDTELNARFPTEIDGQPVTNVRSSYWLQILCYSGDPQAIQQFAQTLGGSSNLAALSYGTADATVDDESVTIEGLRAPGQDANLMVQQLETFLTALGVDPADIAGRTTAQANVGGKNAWTITDEDGDVTYAYASGDVLFTVSSVSEAQAATIFAALP